MADDVYQQSLKYHMLNGKPGKIEVVPTKPCDTQRDLSLAYSPGVAEPCRQIHADQSKIFDYTNKGNLVAVISNGTAVLGLGNIGPHAGKPVMEGKAVLFKKFADIDVFDIEVNETDPDKFMDAVEAIAPTFGGINLEDIKGPECFRIEQELEKRLDIPVFHDDQHGTAIIASAALLNAAELTGRKIEEMTFCFSGAGAAGLSVARLFVKLGVNIENVLLCDVEGVIHSGRTDLPDVHLPFARETEKRTMAEALVGCDCFIGCSVGNVLKPEMLKTMADKPIVFAMANPTPEIDYPLAIETRPDAIVATGRSDYPNQVNNVLGFPFLFRGALDVRASHFTDEMKLAAVKAIAALAREPVTEDVARAYGGDHFDFGPNYVIPKPFDPRVLSWVAPAVAEAAMASGVARKEIDIEEYRELMRQKLNRGRAMIAVPLKMAQGTNMRIAMPNANNDLAYNVARMAVSQNICHPVLIGPKDEIKEGMEGVAEDAWSVMDPADGEYFDILAKYMKDHRPLDELSDEYCKERLLNTFVYGTLLTEAGLCDGMVGGGRLEYGQMVKPILQYVTRRTGMTRVAGITMLITKDRPLFFADTTLIQEPSAEELAEIALRSARAVKRMNIEPSVAFVSYANFSSRDDRDIARMRRAYKIVRVSNPELTVWPDVQADVALQPERFREVFGDQIPKQPANILIFPNLHAANAAYRIARVVSGGSTIGPVLLGLKRPCNIMPRGSTEDEIIDMLAITAYNAQRRKKDLDSGKFTTVLRKDQAIHARKTSRS